VTQSTAATAEENAAASQELNQEADESARLVERLERVIYGAARQSGTGPAARTYDSHKTVVPIRTAA
jgi:hypothetical protein